MNPLFDAVSGSSIRAVHDRKKPGDIDLGLGDPRLPIDMEPLEEAMAWVRSNGCGYSPNPGYEELRAAIGAHYNYPGLNRVENVCITLGAQEALYVALRAAVDPSKNDVVIVAPCYPGCETICALNGIRYRTVGLSAESGFAPDAERILEALGDTAGALVLCSPNNPTGRVWPRAELSRLARGLGRRAGPPVQVIWDEVYRELCYTGSYTSFAEIYPHTWVAGSLSKSHGLTGLRLGWLIAPRAGVDRVHKLHHLLITSPPTISQRAALHIFERKASFRVHAEMYRARLGGLLGLWDQCRFDYLAPEGAFFCMLKLPEELGSDSLAASLRLMDELKVVTIPGCAFGMCAEGWLRTTWVAESNHLTAGYCRLQSRLGSRHEAGVIRPLPRVAHG